MNTKIEIPETIGALKAADSCVFSLEMAVFSQFKGAHMADARRKLALYLTGQDRKVNICELADILRGHFDQLRLF